MNENVEEDSEQPQTEVQVSMIHFFFLFVFCLQFYNYVAIIICLEYILYGFSTKLARLESFPLSFFIVCVFQFDLDLVSIHENLTKNNASQKRL